MTHQDYSWLIAGLPFGRPKAGSHVNTFQPARLPIDEWFKAVG